MSVSFRRIHTPGAWDRPHLAVLPSARLAVLSAIMRHASYEIWLRW